MLLSRMELGRFLSIRWWLRWFNKSLIQTGRLTTILALIGLVWIRNDDPELLRLIRAKTFDTYQNIKPRPFMGQSGQVVVIDLDEGSLDEYGQWPWPRTRWAELVEKLTALGATAIAFDIVFPEVDTTSIANLADSIDGITEETRNTLKAIPTNDDVFAAAIKKSKIVVTGHTPLSVARSDPGYARSSIRGELGSDPRPWLEDHPFILRNVEVLDRAAAGRGVFSVAEDRLDGVVRRVSMAVASPNGIFPSLSLESIRLHMGARNVIVDTDESDGLQRIILQKLRPVRENIEIAVDRNARIWVYYTPNRDYKENYIPAASVLGQRVDRSRIEGKIALVGTSSQGLFDVRATPLDPAVPGVEVHANIIENVLNGTQLTRLSTADGFEVLAAIFIGILMIIITPILPARISIWVFMGIMASVIWYSWDAYSTRLELWDPGFPIMVGILIYGFLTYAAFIQEEAQRKQVRSAFGQYLSPDLVKKLADDPDQLALGGEMREMTFMFCDVRGFTSISELFDAQGLTSLINKFLTPMTNLILSQNGTIDKYMGDCIMAFWNAPLVDEDHASDACQSALLMIDALAELNDTLEQEAEEEGREHRPIKIGIGLNTGEACVGNMGSEQRFDYSVLGDSVNLASRLEGQSKAYGVTIVIGDHTAELAPDYAEVELDLIKVKGKTEAVRIHALLGHPDVAQNSDFKALKEIHDRVITSYRNQDWEVTAALIGEARAKIQTMQGIGLLHELDRFYALYEDRMEMYKIEPPPTDWDGVFVATSK
ncbi:MAG: adenylate/guanylate cyclase domain-containing protein [Rhodospirillaceae bacterium]|nr:adenylate/guanylate cyclase domain-containing protein [Rhodospirillaceae bacterium]